MSGCLTWVDDRRVKAVLRCMHWPEPLENWVKGPGAAESKKGLQISRSAGVVEMS